MDIQESRRSANGSTNHLIYLLLLEVTIILEYKATTYISILQPQYYVKHILSHGCYIQIA